MTFLVARNENRQLDDLLQVDFGRVPKKFLLSARTNSKTKNFVYWKLDPSFVFVVIQRMFSSWAHQRTLRFLFRDCRSFYFHSLIKLTFLSSKGLLCLYDKQNNTCLLVDTKFLLCSTRLLTRSLRSLVSYRAQHSKRKSISTRSILYSLFIYDYVSFVRGHL